VHRDIKPANILLKQGKFLLGDFGEARNNTLDSALDSNQTVAGTPLYMAPEMVKLKSKINRQNDSIAHLSERHSDR
jgi:serine/threonine protein kinase